MVAWHASTATLQCMEAESMLKHEACKLLSRAARHIEASHVTMHVWRQHGTLLMTGASDCSRDTNYKLPSHFLAVFSQSALKP